MKLVSTVSVAVAFACASVPPLGEPLPRLEATAFDGRTIVLPDSAAGYVTLVGFGYSRESQDDLSSWVLPFAKEHKPADGFHAYEIPMMGRNIPGLLRGIVNRAMRNTIPKEMRPWFAPHYGDIDDYSRRLRITDRSRVQIFLLDHSGVIRWHAAGRADSAGRDRLRQALASVADREE
ncbi:hypothetical protein FJY69_00020 [candidate division WOR-3 bacterium]|nr:hypothetical protein [candidate division WOR-3 bacterium]